MKAADSPTGAAPRGHDVVIKVAGVGGAGGDVVNRMMAAGLTGVEFLAVNTDVQALRASRAHGKVQIGSRLMRGLGAGGDPKAGQAAAEDDAADLLAALDGADLVFVAAGMGGGTGTGAAPVVARIAREAGALTIGVVTRPGRFEGKRKQGCADRGIAALRTQVDALIVIEMDRVFAVTKGAPLEEVHARAGETLRRGVQALTDMLTATGVSNVDFADVKAILQDGGEVLMGMGEARGQANSGRALEAARRALHSPLLPEASIAGATGAILDIRGGRDVTGVELKEVMSEIEALAAPDARLKYGYVLTEDDPGLIRVTIIATRRPPMEAGAPPGPAPADSQPDLPAFIRRKKKL